MDRGAGGVARRATRPRRGARSARCRARAARRVERRPCAIASSAAPRAAARLREITVADPSEGLRWFDLDARRRRRALDAARRRRRARRADRSAERSLGVRLGDARRRRGLLAFLRRIGLRGAADGRAAEPVRLRAQRADLSPARACRTRATSTTSRRCSRRPGRSSKRHAAARFCLFTSYRALQRAERWLEGRPRAGPRARARPRLAQRAAESVSRRRQRSPARHGQLLAGRRRARPGAAARDDRQAAVRRAERSARASACRGDSSSRRRRVQRAAAAASRARVEARCRSAHPRLRRSRLDRARRSAPAHARLRRDVPRQLAGDARHRRLRRWRWSSRPSLAATGAAPMVATAR